MDYNQLGSAILDKIGGAKNITSLTHCATRLRFTLKDPSLVDEDNLKKIDGVLGISTGSGQFQVIIGNEVPKVYKVINDQLTIKSSDSAENIPQKRIIDKIFDFIPAIFTPILPAIIGAGLIKSVLALTVLLGLSTDGKLYYFINFIGDAPLFFLPVMLAFTTAKKLEVNQFIAVAIAGAMLHPDYRSLVTDAFNLNFISVSGIPVTLASYNASVIPVILMVFALKYFDLFLDKVIPSVMKFFFKPLLEILIISAITFVVLGPLGFVIGIGVSNGLNLIESYAGWLVPTLTGALFPLMVTAGMHYGLVPFMMQSLASNGYETIAGPGNLPSNIAQGAASLAVAMKSKDKVLKKTAITTGTTALLGVTEPALFAITLKYKKVLTSVMLGGGLGGLYAGITGVKSFSFSSPGLLALVAYVGPDGWINVTNAIISMIIAFIATFAIVWFWGYKDLNQAISEEKNTVVDNYVYSPVDGKVISLSEVPDETFSKELLGKGFAVEPSDNQIVSPIAGKITSIFPAKHAIGMVNKQGLELLIHIGIDTVSLNGEGFDIKVNAGDELKVGQLIAECNFELIQSKGLSPITMVVVTNSDHFADFIYTNVGINNPRKTKILELIN